jgi:non-ribosomal peptide synthase protein (TIGR01720 family)
MSDFTERIASLSPERRELLEMFLHEQDTASAWRQEDYVAPRTQVEETLANIWGQVLGVERVGVNDNFFELGGDSIQCIQIVARARQAGIQFSTNDLFERPTVAELGSVARTVFENSAEQDTVTGPVLLTPIQHWFFEQNFVAPHHWNQAVILEAQSDCDPSVLEKALQVLLDHHDALRLRYQRTGADWKQVNAAAGEAVSFSSIDLSGVPTEEQAAAIEDEATRLQASLSLSEGPLMKAAFFRLGPDSPGRLLLITHHLIADGVSFRILLEDLQTAYSQLRRGEEAQLPSKTTSFQQWARLVTEHAQSPEVQEELVYWASEIGTEFPRLPIDFRGGANTEASARIVSVSLTEGETQSLFQSVPSIYRTQINDVLLTALIHAVSQWIGARSILIDLEGHGREEIIEGVDLSRTVGWFTSIFPVRLDITQARTLVDALQSVKNRLRQVPNRGVGYGLLGYLGNDMNAREKLLRFPRREMVFNYLGQFDQVLALSSLFRPAIESYGPLYGPQGIRPYLLQINGSVIGGRLRMNWTYSKNLHRQSAIEAVARRFIDALRELITQSQRPNGVHFTPSDFPEAELSQEELNKIMSSR